MLRGRPDFPALGTEESHGVEQGEIQSRVSGEESAQVAGMAGGHLDRKQLSKERPCGPGGEQTDCKVEMKHFGNTGHQTPGWHQAKRWQEDADIDRAGG